MMKKNPLFIVLAISGAFFVFFLIITAIVFFNTSPSSSGKKKLFGKKSAARIGVIEVNGLIVDSKKTLEEIDHFDDEPSIKGLLVRVNSPGGSVGPSQEIYEAIQKIGRKKPVYVSMGSVAASGGYYISCGAKKIFANPGTITGSIGVIMPFFDLSSLYQWAKIKSFNIKTGRFKDLGSTTRAMTPDEKALIQEMLDNVLGQFRKAVAVGRKLPMEKIVPVSDGRILTGEQAFQVKLVDVLGGFNEAVEALAKELGLGEKPKLVYFSRKKKLLDLLLETDEDVEESSSSLIQKFTSMVVGKVFPVAKQPLFGPLYLMPQGSF